METNIFEQASRKALRFPTAKGLLTTEDLWSLPLRTGAANLNDIAKVLSKQVRDAGEEEFVPTAGRVSGTTNASLSLEVVKRIIEVRLAEDAAKATVEATKAQNQRILEILAQKKDASLTEKTEDELRAMLVPV
jgi:hypothetical protein